MAEVLVYGTSAEQLRELTGFVRAAGLSPVALVAGPVLPEDVRAIGAERIIWLRSDAERPESYARPLADELARRDMRALLVSSSARSRELAASVAGLLDAPMLSDIAALSFCQDTLEAEHIIFGGMLCRTVVLQGFAVVTVPAGLFEGELVCAEAASVEEIVAEGVDERLSVTSREKIVRTGVDLAAAKTIVCVGLGVCDIAGLKDIEGLADAAGGAIACTRGVAEDRGWLSADLYLGISGKMLSPDLYLGVAVSGQVQHVYGIRGAKTIAAINSDEKAPIVAGSDYCVIGDYREIVPALRAAWPA